MKKRNTAGAPITTSLFELFKIGPGPSSSHTIGPMRAGDEFRQPAAALPEQRRRTAARLTVEFFGSLADTGPGHGTDRAVAAGLLGCRPESCDPDRLAKLLTPAEPAIGIDLDGVAVPFDAGSILWCGQGEHDFPYQNTMRFRLLDRAGQTLLARVCYSVGGGFIQWEGAPPDPPRRAPYRYGDLASFMHLAARHPDRSFIDLLLANELAIGPYRTLPAIHRALDGIIDAMCRSVARGLAAAGLLPGPIGLARRARRLHAAAATAHGSDRPLLYLDAFVLAAAEENAAGSIVVTAPTSGSAGLLAGTVYYLKTQRRVSRRRLREALCAAGLIGFIAKHNSSISGAEVGCQGEVGIAAAMAAAMLAYLRSGSLAVIESAAEIALEHHLGMTCDPVGGYVQIPCIERNAVGAATAYNAFLLAAFSDPAKHKISFDQVIAAMLRTGRALPVELRETSRAGLALCTLCD